MRRPGGENAIIDAYVPAGEARHDFGRAYCRCHFALSMIFGKCLWLHDVISFGLQKVPDAVICFQYVLRFGLNVAFDLSADIESPSDGSIFLRSFPAPSASRQGRDYITKRFTTALAGCYVKSQEMVSDT